MPVAATLAAVAALAVAATLVVAALAVVVATLAVVDCFKFQTLVLKQAFDS